jgi:uncharacterized protein YgbK (DUF1537 family)
VFERGRDGLVIIISGSLSAITSRQLDEVRRARRGKIIPVDVLMHIEDQEAGLEESEIVSEIISAAGVSRVVGIQSVKKGSDGQSIEHGRKQGSPLLVVEYLGRIALRIIRDCTQPVRGLIVSGGDTALAVFKHLGISRVRLVDEVLPGIPYGQVMGGEFAGLIIVTKAGAFGDESALVKCIDFLL